MGLIRHGGRVIPLGGGAKTYIQKIKALFGTSLIAYYPLNETSGTTALDASGNGRNGTYTGVDLANTAAPGKTLAPYFDGANDFVDIYSAGLATAFDKAIGSIAAWVKFPSGAWTDGALRFAFTFWADGDNRLHFAKSSTNNTLGFTYRAAGTSKSVTVGSLSTTSWIFLTLTWSKASDQVIAYFNGAQTGDIQTSVPTWVGALSSTATSIGSANVSPITYPYQGHLAHAMLLNRVATPTEITAVYNWGV